MAKAATKTTVKRSESTAASIKRATPSKAPTRLAKPARPVAEPPEEMEPPPRVVFNLDEAIRALAPDVAWLPPEVPVELIVREAEQVSRAARPHRNKMRKLPTKIDLLDTLEARAHALAAAEEEYRAARLARLKTDLRPLREEAETLKRELLTAAQFLLRDEPQIFAQLSAVSDGDADVVTVGLGDELKEREIEAIGVGDALAVALVVGDGIAVVAAAAARMLAGSGTAPAAAAAAMTLAPAPPKQRTAPSSRTAQ